MVLSVTKLLEETVTNIQPSKCIQLIQINIIAYGHIIIQIQETMLTSIQYEKQPMNA